MICYSIHRQVEINLVFSILFCCCYIGKQRKNWKTIKIFRLEINSEILPESFDIYISLAEKIIVDNFFLGICVLKFWRNPVYCSLGTNTPPPFYFWFYAYFRLGARKRLG